MTKHVDDVARALVDDFFANNLDPKTAELLANAIALAISSEAESLISDLGPEAYATACRRAEEATSGRGSPRVWGA
jgi:hypothetical protein